MVRSRFMVVVFVTLFVLASCVAPIPVDDPDVSAQLVLGVVSVTASGHDGNVPENTLDGDPSTRWSSKGMGEWIVFELDELREVQEVNLSWYVGERRVWSFDVAYSEDGSSWVDVYSGSSSGTSTGIERHELPDAAARYVRITGLGNNESSWNSITEVSIIGLPIAEDTVRLEYPSVPVVRSSLRGDPSFDASQLGPEAAFWHARILETIENPGDDLDPLELADSDNLYQYGRTLQVYVQSVLTAFRVTGDLRLLDHVDEISERMRAQLRDPWRDTKDGTDGTTDGYVNWVFRYSSSDSHYGKDIGWVDEMKTHALIALIAAALDENRDLSSPGGRDYAASADAWEEYLVNDFEAKWRERRGIESGLPYLSMSGMHTSITWLRFHYYMADLTGDDAYLQEADRMADAWWNEMRPIETSAGTAYVWPRSTSGSPFPEYLMPTVYASMVYADVVELRLEGYDRWAHDDELRRFARTFATFVMDTDDPVSNDLAADIGGEYDRAGLPSDAQSWPRMTMHGYWLSGYPQIAAWDDSGRIVAFTQDVHDRRRTNTGMMLESGMLVHSMLATNSSE